MEQLGPFHFFFTLSSAEMRWNEVTLSIVNCLGDKIIYDDGWKDDESKILVEKSGKINKQYAEGGLNKT